MGSFTVHDRIKQKGRPIKKAKGYLLMMEEAGGDVEEVARLSGVAVSTIVKHLSLLDLCPPVQEMMELRNQNQRLAFSTAVVLVRVTNAEWQLETAKIAVEKRFDAMQMKWHIEANVPPEYIWKKEEKNKAPHQCELEKTYR